LRAPTHYALEGNTLVQIVDHASGEYSYPIVADRSHHHLGRGDRPGGPGVVMMDISLLTIHVPMDGEPLVRRR
jgi:hypothetical protein